MVRAHASHAEGLRFEPDSMPWMNAHSLFTQQQKGTWWEHWGDKGREERDWPPYLTSRWLRISVLSNRHSPTYESIQDYLHFSYLLIETWRFPPCPPPPIAISGKSWDQLWMWLGAKMTTFSENLSNQLNLWQQARNREGGTVGQCPQMKNFAIICPTIELLICSLK